MIECGEYSFTDVDDANIPVDIWLSQIDPNSDSLSWDDRDGLEAGGWKLTAGIYCPRNNRTEGSACCAYGTRDELVELIRTKIMPLYQTALSVLEGMCQGTEESLYYWRASTKGDV